MRARPWTAIAVLITTVLITTVLITTVLATPAPAGAAQTSPLPSDPVTFEHVASIDELTDSHARIFRLYWAYFDREPDPSGALFWVDRYEQCWDLHRIASFFTASPEFGATYGPLDNAAFVDLVYANVFERVPDAEGRSYWTGRLEGGSLDRTTMMLDFSWSPEFVQSHPLPSDAVANRGCRQQSAGAAFQSYVMQYWTPFATVGGITLHHPATAVAHIGFHQSNRGGGLAQEPLVVPTPMTTMPSRYRGTPARSAADIVVHPLLEVRSPVTGTVLRSGNYTLYCRYTDGFVVVRPDAQPNLEVGVLHITGVRVRPGQRVEAGSTVLAAHATLFPFSSQVDDYTATPWPHVHVEVVDPTIPNRPSSSGC